MMALRVCPWCNGVPVWVGQDHAGQITPWPRMECEPVGPWPLRSGSPRALACITPQCGLQPKTRWRGASRQRPEDDLEDVAAWNRRLTDPPLVQPPGAFQALMAQIYRNMGQIDDLHQKEAHFPPEAPRCE